ncbi:bifunctional DNA-formamidopyrimidine glycosylase/DNA-(apurinic or apyrimidinic site) lyase [Mucisphaera sp.]|uniref:bifunctional DNA-formamidopyrimidine glycosylase/DNA-(apurinic or apyrimidinic site) lyase n=1 Tax=Mucisphaera sp. TaxID=2913024 RepID=UPI003D0EB380
MPELPEVETIRRGLAAEAVGRRVLSVAVRRADFVRTGAGRRSAEVVPEDGALLVGDVVDRVERRGKQMAVVGRKGGVVNVHLGMSGSVAAGPSGLLEVGVHTHVRWELAGGRAVSVTDPRRFGGVWVYPSMAALEAERWSSLGPDALEVEARELLAGFSGSRRAVKAALLDQRVVAGVGNIYADESLHRAGISPVAEAGVLNIDQVKRLVRSLRRVLREAVSAGGSSLRDHVMLNGEAGAFQHAHRVYGRSGEACLKCRGELASGLVAQRTTVWCPVCQPLCRNN